MAQYEPQYYSPPPPSDITSDDKLMAGLSYIFNPVVPLIVLLSESNKRRPFQRYHAINALALEVVVVVVGVVLALVVFAISAAITLITFGLGSLCTFPLMLAIPVVPLIPMIIYAVKAFNGEYAEIPWLTNFVRQQGWL